MSDIVEVSTIFMEYEHKILVLHRAPGEVLEKTWGIPGGQLEQGERPIEGLLREISEELQLKPNPEEIEFVGSLQFSYRLYLFRWVLSSQPEITLNPQEHDRFLWQPISTFADLPLLKGQLEAFQFVYSRACRQLKR